MTTFASHLLSQRPTAVLQVHAAIDLLKQDFFQYRQKRVHEGLSVFTYVMPPSEFFNERIAMSTLFESDLHEFCQITAFSFQFRCRRSITMGYFAIYWNQELRLKIRSESLTSRLLVCPINHCAMRTFLYNICSQKHAHETNSTCLAH